MSLPRGFKAGAARIATDLRAEMQISGLDRFDPFAAAEYLGIPLFPFAVVIDDHPAIAGMLDEGRLSAMTVHIGKHFRAFFYDDRRAQTRIVSDIAHEIAHALLQHPPHLASELFCSGIDRTAEDEAAYLSGVLLVSDESALHVVSGGIPMDSACRLYGVSEQMMRYRINVSGAKVRVLRRQSALGA